MKKLISLILVICIFCSLLMGCVNEDEDLRMKRIYLRQFKIKDVSPQDVVVDYDGGTYNGARIVMLDAERHDLEEWTDFLGKSGIDYYDSNRLWAYKYGRFYDLKEAYSLSIISEEDYAKIANEYRIKIKHFIDVCDVYDFDSCQETHIGTDHVDYSGKQVCHENMWIYLDKNLFSGLSTRFVEDRQKIVDYINSCVGINLVSSISSLVDFIPNTNMCYTEITLNNDSVEKLPQIMESLSKVPGVIKLYCHCLLVNIGV